MTNSEFEQFRVDMSYIPTADPAYDVVKDAPHDINARWAVTAALRYAMNHLLEDPHFIKQVGTMSVRTLKLYNKGA